MDLSKEDIEDFYTEKANDYQEWLDEGEWPEEDGTYWWENEATYNRIMEKARKTFPFEDIKKHYLDLLAYDPWDYVYDVVCVEE